MKKEQGYQPASSEIKFLGAETIPTEEIEAIRKKYYSQDLARENENWRELSGEKAIRYLRAEKEINQYSKSLSSERTREILGSSVHLDSDSSGGFYRTFMRMDEEGHFQVSYAGHMETDDRYPLKSGLKIPRVGVGVVPKRVQLDMPETIKFLQAKRLSLIEEIGRRDIETLKLSQVLESEKKLYGSYMSPERKKIMEKEVEKGQLDTKGIKEDVISIDAAIESLLVNQETEK